MNGGNPNNTVRATRAFGDNWDYASGGNSTAVPDVAPIESMNGGVVQTTLDVTPQSLCVNTFVYLGN